jgi:predicted ABC-type transport system involved in lysophospholipase L1 biosynthesis ATPase subunit
MRRVSVTIRKLQVRFGQGELAKVVLRLESFELGAGARVCLVGPSGSGKSTLLNVLSGVLAVSEGDVKVAGTQLRGLSEPKRDAFRARHVGFVFQSFHLLQCLSALENVMLPLHFAGVGGAEARQRAKAMLERMGLGTRMHGRPAELSVGEQQRVALARALAPRPRLVLADEPTASLDSDAGAAAMDLLLESVAECQATLLCVTHESEVMRRFSDVRHMKDIAS